MVCATAVLLLLGYFAAEEFDPRKRAPSRMQEFVYSPFVDVSLSAHSANANGLNFFDGSTRTLRATENTVLPLELNALTLAFATGECGDEHWAGLPAKKFADANLLALRKANIGYIVSTGGAHGIFRCTSEDGMRKFIARYTSSHLLGFDFDIETYQSQDMLESLIEQIRRAMLRYPTLRFSFTLQSIAATETGGASLSPLGVLVMQTIARAGLKDYFVNLMVMNFGEAVHGNCVIRQGQCDMSASAIQVVQDFAKQYQLPLHRIEVTPMIGVNDVQTNVFTVSDAQRLARFVRSSGLGGVHFWSLNRDEPCGMQLADVSSTCHHLGGVRKLEFTNTIATNLR
jgi:hypothetical protein